MLRAFFHASNLPISQPTNWDRLIADASCQLVLPAMGHQSRARGIQDQLPADVLSLFNAAEALNAERNQAILSEAVHVAGLLNQIGIQPVALKGLAYLLTGTYPNPAFRYVLDIDLLLSPDQIPAAASQLFQHGYAKNESAYFVQLRHHYPAICRPNSPNIEIHHRVGQGICNRILPASTLLSNASPIQFNDTTFLVPSPTDLTNHLILHSQLAHPYSERIFPPLRALVDLTYIQTRFASQIDWLALLKTYRENDQLGTLLLHLHQAKDTLGFQIPRVIPQNLSPSLTIRHQRRKLLNHHPTARFLDPTYLLMSLFSRRIRLLPPILKNPSSWPDVLRLLTSRDFYSNLVG